MTLYGPDEEILLAKATLGCSILRKRRKISWSKYDLINLLQVPEEDVIELINGKFAEFSLEDLLRFVRDVGLKVTILVEDKP